MPQLAGTTGVTNLGPQDSQGVPFSLYAGGANSPLPAGYVPSYPTVPNSQAAGPYGVGEYTAGASSQGSTNDANAGTDAGTSSGMDWGQILNGLGSILGSPVVSSGALIGLGESAAAQQQSQTKGLTDQLTKPAQPFVQGGVSELQATQQGLTGAPVQGGSIGQQEQVASQFGDIAKQYSTGQLTPAQSLQVQQQSQAQKQAIRAQLAQQGITDSSVLAMYDQQIDNNTSILTQQMTQQNIGIAAQAQAAVQQTYSNLINDSIAQFGAGMGPIEDAINLTIQQNTQIAQGLQSLFGQIARGFMGATSGGQSPTAGIGQGLSQIGNQIGKAFGGGSSFPGVPTTDVNASANIGDTLSGFGDSSLGTATDIAGPDPSVVGDLGTFSSAGGQAADALTPSAMGDFSFAPGLAGASAPGDVAMTSEVSNALSQAGGAGSSAGSGAASGLSGNQALGAVGAGLSLANEVSTWKSGKTGSDALSGAETGAAVGGEIGSIVPGIGTGIGAVVGFIGGGIAGAVSSLFGSGADPENADFKQYTQAYNNAPANMKAQVAGAVTNPYIALAGYMDLHSMDGQNPIYQKYGRMGEQAFTDDLIKQVNQAKASGQTDPTQIWNSTVEPWINSMGTWQDTNKDAMTALIQNMTGQIAAGTYQQNFKARSGDEPFASSSAPSGTSNTVGQYRAETRYGLGLHP